MITGVIAILKRGVPRSTLELALALLVLGFFPDSPTVRVGQRQRRLAGFLAWAWVIGRGRLPVGAFAGLGATIKLVPGALIFWSNPRTFPRVLAGAAAVAGVLFVLTLPLVGLASWADYVTALSLSEPACGVDVPVSLACVLKPIIGIGPAKLAGMLLALVAGIAAVFVRAPLASFGLVVVAWLAPVTDSTSIPAVIYVLAVIAGAGAPAVSTRASGDRRSAASDIRTA